MHWYKGRALRFCELIKISGLSSVMIRQYSQNLQKKEIKKQNMKTQENVKVMLAQP